MQPFLAYADHQMNKDRKNTGSVLRTTSKMLKDRISLKAKGMLQIGQQMTVQSLIHDLLKNGIDLSILGETKLKHSISLKLDKWNSQAVPQMTN